MASHSSSPRSSVGTRFVRPAQFTMMSTLPNASTVAASSAFNDAESVTSDATRSVRRPSCSISGGRLVDELSAARRGDDVGTGVCQTHA